MSRQLPDNPLPPPQQGASEPISGLTVYVCSIPFLPQS